MEAIRDAVLVENITVTEGPGQTLDIGFEFLCRNCGRRHWAREIACRHLIPGTSVQLNCGRVNLRFPWTVTPQRDQDPIYGSDGASLEKLLINTFFSAFCVTLSQTVPQVQQIKGVACSDA